jgi:hypothetical protein
MRQSRRNETTAATLRRWADRAEDEGVDFKCTVTTIREVADELEGYRKLLHSMQRSMASHCGNIADALGATMFKAPED